MVIPRFGDRAWQSSMAMPWAWPPSLPGLSTASILDPDALGAVARGGGRGDPGIVPGYGALSSIGRTGWPYQAFVCHMFPCKLIAEGAVDESWVYIPSDSTRPEHS